MRRTNERKGLRCTLALVLVTALAGASAAWADCETATAVTVNDTYHSSGSELLKVTLAGSGILTLDVSSPAAAAVQPMITFLGTSCTTPTGEGSDFDFVQETPAWLALLVSTATTYYFEVEPQGSQQTLADFKLIAGWVAESTTPDEENALPSDATDTCNASSTPLSENAFDHSRFVTTAENIEQSDDDIMRIAATVPGVMLVDIVDAESEAVTATLFEDDSCAAAAQLGEAALTPTSGRLTAVVHSADHSLKVVPYQSADGAYEVAVRLFTPCGLGDVDDHGDTAMCATPIAVDGSDSGELANADDDDEDYFSFVLGSQQTIDIESTGGTDTYGSLYDAAGQRLDADDDGGTGDNFLISHTLGAGRYSVRVEGAGGAEGSYGIEVSAVP